MAQAIIGESIKFFSERWRIGAASTGAMGAIGLASRITPYPQSATRMALVGAALYSMFSLTIGFFTHLEDKSYIPEDNDDLAAIVSAPILTAAGVAVLTASIDPSASKISAVAHTVLAALILGPLLACYNE